MLGLVGDFFDDLGEDGGLMDGEMGEDFAVQLDVFSRESFDELTVAGRVF